MEKIPGHHTIIYSTALVLLVSALIMTLFANNYWAEQLGIGVYGVFVVGAILESLDFFREKKKHAGNI